MAVGSFIGGPMRTFVAFLAAAVAAVSLNAQTAKLSPGAMYGADPSYMVPRTPDGHPDLQGVWSNNGVTPMTRPTQWKDKPLITDAELDDLKKLVAQNADQGGDAIFQNQVQLALDARDKGQFDQTSYDRTTGNYNQFWMVERDWDHRTSLIFDPPNGQFPPLTREAEARGRGRRNAIPGNPPANEESRPRPEGPEDLPLGERCLSFGAPRTGAGYNSYLQIIQAPDTVVLLQEMAHDARIVPIGSKPHLPKTVRQWLGDPRGRWDGDTLVVETTNYLQGFMGSTPDVRVTERYTRVSHDYVNWVITVDDPKTWTQPWSFLVRLKRTDDQVYEYACHEGNYSLPGILAGARAEERKEAEANARRPK
jgi:hypothetical protein